MPDSSCQGLPETAVASSSRTLNDLFVMESPATDSIKLRGPAARGSRRRGQWRLGDASARNRVSLPELTMINRLLEEEEENLEAFDRVRQIRSSSRNK